MSLYNYVDAPNTNLLCCICRTPFTDPVTTMTCQHTFCRECITRALSHAPQCPVDRSPLCEDDLGPVNPIVRSLVDELTVECVYREEGCQRVVQRQLLAAHLRDECEFSEAGVVRSEMDKGKGKAKEVDAELAEGDPKEVPATTPAPNASADETEPVHAAGDTTSRNSPPTSTHRVSRLTEQNVLLRHRVDTLEGAVQFLRKEVAMVRTVLSPWIQNCASSSAQPSTVSSTRRASPARSNATQGSNFLPHQSLSQASQNAPGGAPDSTENESGNTPFHDNRTIDHNDLASYFPADDEVRVRRSTGPEPNQSQRHRPSNGHMHHHSVPAVVPGVPPAEIPPPQVGLGMGFYGHPSTTPYGSIGHYGGPAMVSPLNLPGYQSQPLSIAVPELDTSTPSLSTTLQGLHSGVVTLASSIEDIHKKSDMALALIGGGTAGTAIPGGGVVGEVLRLGEELMGVRATVQGLRMQMHGLMMGNVGSGVGGAGMGFGTPGRPPQAPSISTNANGLQEERAAAEGYGLPSPIQQGLQNQRLFYPVAGITKL